MACPVLNYPPEAMSAERVWEIIDEFGDAAVRAKKAGADGVEVHGAHGYLVAQFMSPHASKRTDEFGGDFFGRMKLPQEIFKNIRGKAGFITGENICIDGRMTKLMIYHGDHGWNYQI